MKVLLRILETALGWQAVLPQRQIRSIEEFVQRFPAVKDVFVDGTERLVQRPQQAKAQRELYSGKQHEHTLENLVVSDEDRHILCLTKTRPGARQDYYRFKQTGLGEVIPDKVWVWVDLGFVGIVKDYPCLQVVIPHKSSKNHPLTPEQKAENQVISTFRIRVEHTIAGIKRFRCLTDAYRNKGTILADKFMLIACGLLELSPLACLILLSLRSSYHFSSTLFRNTSNAFQLQNHPKKKSPDAFFKTWDFFHPISYQPLTIAAYR